MPSMPWPFSPMENSLSAVSSTTSMARRVLSSLASLLRALSIRFSIRKPLLTARSGAWTGAGQAQAGFVAGARGLGIALAAASLALLYYAKAGVEARAHVAEVDTVGARVV